MSVVVVPYSASTTSKLSGSEVPTSVGGAFGAVPVLPGSACSSVSTDEEWVPARETALVPTELTAICRRCPVRQACLTWAVQNRPMGYWAATTTADRARLAREDEASVARADEMQDEIFDEVYPSPMHSGPGCRHWYRRGCRCQACRADRSAYRDELRSCGPAAAGTCSRGCKETDSDDQ